MDTHRFIPSRPNGVVCVVVRAVPHHDHAVDAEVCGYPAGHPIHAETLTPAEARTGVSDRTAAALNGVAELRRRLSGELEDALTVKRYSDDLLRLDRIEQALRASVDPPPAAARPEARTLALASLKRALRAAIIEHGTACYRRGRANASGLESAKVTEQRAVAKAMDALNEIINRIGEEGA